MQSLKSDSIFQPEKQSFNKAKDRETKEERRIIYFNFAVNLICTFSCAHLIYVSR